MHDPDLLIRTSRRAAHVELPAVAVRVLASSSSRPSCGRTSRAPTWRKRCRSTTRASAASAADRVRRGCPADFAQRVVDRRARRRGGGRADRHRRHEAFALTALFLGGAAMGELWGMYERVGPVKLAGFLALVGVRRRGATTAASTRCCSSRSRVFPVHVRAGAGDAGRPVDDRAHVADGDGHLSGSASRSRTPCCCASCRTAATSSSTC